MIRPKVHWMCCRLEIMEGKLELQHDTADLFSSDVAKEYIQPNPQSKSSVWELLVVFKKL